MRAKKKILLTASVLVLIVFVLYLIQKQTLRIDVEQTKTFIRSFGYLVQ